MTQSFLYTLTGLSWRRLPGVTKAWLCACIMVVIISLGISFHDCAVYPGIDIRSRIVGARAMLAGLDPYFFYLGAATPERLNDPGRSPTIARCTYPPTVLLVYTVFSALPYVAQRFLWAGIEWASLLGSILLLIRRCGPPRTKIFFIILASLFFAGGYFWRLHVERGQYYVLILALLTIGSTLCLQYRNKSWLGPLLMGLAVAMRPTLLVLPVFLFFANQRRTAILIIGGAVLAVACTLPWGLGPWKNYPRAAAASWEVSKGTVEVAAPALATIAPAAPVVEAHPLVEGYRYTDNSALLARTIDLSVRTLSARFLRSPALSKLPLVPALVVVLLIVAVVAARLSVRGSFSLQNCLGAAFVFAFAADYLAPVRYGYADVVLLLPLGLLMPVLTAPRISWVPLALVIVGLLLGHSLFVDLNIQFWYPGTLARSLGLFAAFAGALVYLVRRQPSAIYTPTGATLIDAPVHAGL